MAKVAINLVKQLSSSQRTTVEREPHQKGYQGEDFGPCTGKPTDVADEFNAPIIDTYNDW